MTRGQLSHAASGPLVLAQSGRVATARSRAKLPGARIISHLREVPLQPSVERVARQAGADRRVQVWSTSLQ
jgi:hypothetical protein